MINQWGRKHFIALTQPFPSYQQSSLSLLLKSQRTLELRSLDPGSSQTEAGKLAGLSTSHLSPESPLNGLNLCIPAQSHLLIRPQETAWFPNGSMACSWQQNKGRGEQRSKVKAQRRHYPKKNPKKQKTAPSEVWGRGVHGSGGQFLDLSNSKEPACKNCAFPEADFSASFCHVLLKQEYPFIPPGEAGGGAADFVAITCRPHRLQECPRLRRTEAVTEGQRHMPGCTAMI